MSLKGVLGGDKARVQGTCLPQDAVSARGVFQIIAGHMFDAGRSLGTCLSQDAVSQAQLLGSAGYLHAEVSVSGLALRRSTKLSGASARDDGCSVEQTH
jgi:hypothetical protein